MRYIPATCSEMTSPTAARGSPAPCMWIGVIVITATIATFDAAITTTPIKASRGQEGRLLRTSPTRRRLGHLLRGVTGGEQWIGPQQYEQDHGRDHVRDHRHGERPRAGEHAEGVGEWLGRRGEVRAGNRARRRGQQDDADRPPRPPETFAAHHPAPVRTSYAAEGGRPFTTASHGCNRRVTEAGPSAGKLEPVRG